MKSTQRRAFLAGAIAFAMAFVAAVGAYAFSGNDLTKFLTSKERAGRNLRNEKQENKEPGNGRPKDAVLCGPALSNADLSGVKLKAVIPSYANLTGLRPVGLTGVDLGNGNVSYRLVDLAIWTVGKRCDDGPLNGGGK